MSAAPPFRPYDGQRYDASLSVGHRLSQLMILMRREVEVRMAAHDLTDAQWKPLWLIKSGHADTGQALARLLAVDAAAVTRSLDRLEAKGLLERARCEHDRRVVRLRLTPAGEAAVAAVPPVLAEVNNDFLRGFDEAEWRQLLALIERLTANGQALQNTRQDA